MFTPGMQPGAMDSRRAMGQRVLASLLPRLLSYRFQGSQRPQAPAPAPSPVTADRPGVGIPPGFNPSRLGMSSGFRPSTPVMQPPPAASAPGRPGLTGALSQPAPRAVPPPGTPLVSPIGVGGPSPVPGPTMRGGDFDNAGFSLPAFIQYLNMLSGRGDAVGGAGGAAAGGAAGGVADSGDRSGNAFG